MKNKYIKTRCCDCKKQLGYSLNNTKEKRCRQCRSLLLKQNPSANSMFGRKQDTSKFRLTYSNVDYLDYKLVKNKTGKLKRHYRMNCIGCGSDRGYKIHNEAKRQCLKCHALKYTKKSKEQKKIYNSMKANINACFKHRNLEKQEGVFRYLPYTIHDLMKHLESQFEPWMNWDNHGPYNKNIKTWQIDHIVPDSSFSYKDTSDKDFIASWSLSNLRPLESLENILKSDKLI